MPPAKPDPATSLHRPELVVDDHPSPGAIIAVDSQSPHRHALGVSPRADRDADPGVSSWRTGPTNGPTVAKYRMAPPLPRFETTMARPARLGHFIVPV
jgi:hypothetical protein